MRVLKKLKISTTISEDRGLMLQLNLHTKSAKKIVSYVGKQKNKIRQDFCGSIPLKFGLQVGLEGITAALLI